MEQGEQARLRLMEAKLATLTYVVKQLVNAHPRAIGLAADAHGFARSKGLTVDEDWLTELLGKPRPADSSWPT